MDLPLVGYDPYLNDLMVKCCEAAIAVTGHPAPVRSGQTVENAIAAASTAR